jgi:DNA repair protein RecO (recombination protein O)
MTSFNKILLEPAFVLHTRPYQETSLIVEFFTQSFGRINAVAKGAKRPKSPLRSILTPVSRLSVSLSGKSELKNLSSAEILDHYPLSDGASLNSIIYINELIAKATEKEDPHEIIFLKYQNFLENISKNNNLDNLELLLRDFEMTLLQEMGYGIDLTRDAETNNKLKEDTNYRFDPNIGFTFITAGNRPKISFLGKDIIDFSEGKFEKKSVRAASKIIMRTALDYHLGNKSLNIRKYLTKNN